jgi:hypothetical protein
VGWVTPEIDKIQRPRYFVNNRSRIDMGKIGKIDIEKGRREERKKERKIKKKNKKNKLWRRKIDYCYWKNWWEPRNLIEDVWVSFFGGFGILIKNLTKRPGITIL